MPAGGVPGAHPAPVLVPGVRPAPSHAPVPGSGPRAVLRAPSRAPVPVHPLRVRPPPPLGRGSSVSPPCPALAGPPAPSPCPPRPPLPDHGPTGRVGARCGGTDPRDGIWGVLVSPPCQGLRGHPCWWGTPASPVGGIGASPPPGIRACWGCSVEAGVAPGAASPGCAYRRKRRMWVLEEASDPGCVPPGCCPHPTPNTGGPGGPFSSLPAPLGCGFRCAVAR